MGLDFAIIKDQFFDRPKVADAVSDAAKRGLMKHGAFVRRRAKSSIKAAPKIDVATGQITRKRKGLTLRDASAKPGNPPYSHRGDLKRLIFFVFDNSTQTVVVGPAAFTSKTGRKGPPELLEHGGASSVTRTVFVKTGKPASTGRPATLRQKESFLQRLAEGRVVHAKKQKIIKAARYKGNPFMVPAAAAERRNFLKRFEDTL